MKKSRASLLFITSLTFIIVLVTTRFNYERLKMENRWYSTIDSTTTERMEIDQEINTKLSTLGADSEEIDAKPATLAIDPKINIKPSALAFLPRGIIAATSDLELKPLWERNPLFQGKAMKSDALLAIAVGLKQKQNVDIMVKKFLLVNCSIILFHYDGNVDAWSDLEWSSKAVHILAHNQTKWWFAKRFLHPDVVSVYEYIFLWDEDLGVENFHPGRYLQIMISEGLEISQPALDPDVSEVHHRITVRNKTGAVHRRAYSSGGSLKCSDESTGPPCTGWVEGMAPVFSHAAWECVWHLIQNDLIHGWGLDMKLGYCAQGDRKKKVGVIDSEYIIHHGIPTLGGPSGKPQRYLDLRTHIRRQSTAELNVFRQRWDQAVKEDEEWTDPFGT